MTNTRARCWIAALAIAVGTPLGTSCDEQLVTLGRAPEPASGGADAGGGAGGSPSEGGAGDANTAGADGELVFGEPRLLQELASDAKEENPTFTDDMELVFFTTTREDGDANVWSARFDSGSGLYADSKRVEEASTGQDDTSPAISSDGLTLWVGLRRDDGLGEVDIWELTRATRDSAWSSPRNLTVLNSTASDIPRPPGIDGTVMPLASRREGPYRTYFARRSAPGADFETPEPIPELVVEEGYSIVDAFLTRDGKTLFFASTLEEDKTDLFVTRRASVENPFDPPVPIDALNTEDFDERDPFLSADGTRFFFASNRGGNYDIYEVAVTRE